MPGESPAPVWIIDNEQWPRATLRAELLARGYEVVGFHRVLHALARLNDAGVPRPAIVVLELRDQPVSPALLGALRETGLPVILLGGAVELSDPSLAAVLAVAVAVLRRPFSVGDVVNAVARVASPDISPPEPPSAPPAAGDRPPEQS